jgi:hypothetical protein
MTNPNNRWEIRIKEENLLEFYNLLHEVDKGDIGSSVRVGNGHVWVKCNPSSEFKVLALLRFEIEVENAYGTEIPLE